MRDICDHRGRQLHKVFNKIMPRLAPGALGYARGYSGLYEISPNSLSNVMAVSSGDAIFVAASLLCDPIEEPLRQEIRRVLGNVGQPGIAL